MTDSLRLYRRYAATSLKGQMAYRASFWMMTLGHLLATGAEFLAIWALFARFGSLRGWTLAEVALFYGMVGIAFALAEGIGRGFDIFPALVKAGDFDRFLLRPRSTVLQVAGTELQLMRVGRLLQATVILGWAVAALDVSWTPDRVLLLLFCIAGGACLFYGLFIIQAALSFWTVETLEIMNTVTYGGTETAQYPMTIYRPWFRRFFTFVVPLACMNYLPASVLLARHAAGIPPLLGWLSPAAGIAFFLVSLRIWHFGVRHYRSTGS